MRFNIRVLVILIVVVGFCGIAVGGPYQKDANTLMLLHFDEGSGNSTADASGNMSPGKIEGAAWTTGKFGNALSFNGKSDYVNMGNVLDLGTGDFTIEAWVKFGPFGPDNRGPHNIVAKHDAGNAGFRFYVDSYGRLGIVVRRGDSTTGWKVAKTPMCDNKWHHVAMTRSGSTVKVYVDSVLDGTFDNGNADVNVGDPLVIGAIYAKGKPSEYFKGAIDEVRISNKVRSFSEMGRIY
jgi:hypothetical protein